MRAAPERAREEIVDHLVGRIVVHPDLFEHDVALFAQLFGIEPRVQEHIAPARRPRPADAGRSRARRRPSSSLSVAALRLPPTASISSAMRRALRRAVPLKSMCSSRCEMPRRCAARPTSRLRRRCRRVAERTCGIVSVSKRTPPGSTLSRIIRSTRARVRAGKSDPRTRSQAAAARAVARDAPWSRTRSRTVGRAKSPLTTAPLPASAGHRRPQVDFGDRRIGGERAAHQAARPRLESAAVSIRR